MTRATPSLRSTVSRPPIHSRGLDVFLGLLFLFAFERFVFFFGAGPLAVTVVRLVVEHQDILVVHQLGRYTLEHLSFGLKRLQLGAMPLQQSSPALRKLEPLA